MRVIKRDKKTGCLDAKTVRIMILLTRNWPARKIADLHDVTTADVYAVAKATNLISRKHTKPSGSFQYFASDEWNEQTKTMTPYMRRRAQDRAERALKPTKKTFALEIQKGILDVLSTQKEITGVTSADISKKYNQPVRWIGRQLTALEKRGKIKKLSERRRVSKKGVSFVWVLTVKKKEGEK